MERRQRMILRSALLFLALGLLMMAQARQAAAGLRLLDTYKVTYFDTSTSAFVSATGYGGPGSSGGAGDNTVRLINPTQQFGTLCAMIYVFDDNEELQTCCGCPVSPDGMRTLSTLNDLTNRFGVAKGNLNAGVIKVISSDLNFSPGNPPPGPIPPGTNGSTAGACSPTGSLGDQTFHRGEDLDTIAGIRAYITHDEVEQAGGISGGKIASGVSVAEFEDSPLDLTEYNNLQQNCAALISNGSGVGVCTCGVGDNVIVNTNGTTI